MKHSSLFMLLCLVLASLAVNPGLLAQKADGTDTVPEEAKPKIILNGVKSSPQYAYEQWDKKVTSTPAGLLLDAPSGKGGFGANNIKVDIDGFRFLDVMLQTTDTNETQTININLIDVYGSDITWAVRIDQILPKKATTFRLKISDGKSNLKGSRHTIDFTEITGYQVQGDWSDKPAQFALAGILARR